MLNAGYGCAAAPPLAPKEGTKNVPFCLSNATGCFCLNIEEQHPKEAAVRVEDQHPWINTYWVEGELPWQDEHYHVPVSVGDGMLVPGQAYRRFRVVDVWYSSEKHGHFDIGRHIFLRDVTDTEDDRLGRAAPDYFKD